MYHLFVSGDDRAWLGEPWAMPDLSRCLREYTQPELCDRYGSLEPDAVNALRRFPCIFAYEGVRKDPHFGVIREVTKRSGGIRVEYEIIPLDRFLTARQ